jgi:hypothetical protein
MELVATSRSNFQISSTPATWFRRLVVGVAVSFLLLSPLPFLEKKSLTGALTSDYSDHLHHAFISWVFVHKGLDTYRLQFRESAEGVKFRHGFVLWAEMPLNYPPGIVAVFLPLTLVGLAVPMETRTFSALGVVWMLLFAHLAMVAFFQCLNVMKAGWLRNVWAAVAYLTLLRLGLEGFYDSVWLACAAMGTYALQRKEPVHAIAWFCGAALIHYRAIAVFPLGLYACAEAIKGKSWREWPWTAFSFVALTGVLVIGSFALMYPATEEFRRTVTPVWKMGRIFAQVVVPSLVTLALAWLGAKRSLYLSATLVLCAVLAVTDLRLWWHGSLLLTALLAATVFDEGKQKIPLEIPLLGWMVLLQWQLYGRDYPTQVLVDLFGWVRRVGPLG